MIPKKIHYCWFGRGEKPGFAEKCIASWKKYCPGYEIIEWNEDNFDVSCCAYIREGYEAKKYAFVSDFARFYILYHEGGVYFDTDVELIKPIDDLLEKGAFMGCESDGCDLTQRIYEPDLNKSGEVNPGLGIAAAPGLGLYKEIIDFYHTIHFQMPDGSLNTQTVVKYTTEILIKHGLKNEKGIQKVADVWIYPKEYFCPLDDNTGEMNITENTRSIHWYSKSWLSKGAILRSKITKPFHKLFGNNCFSWLKKLLRA